MTSCTTWGLTQTKMISAPRTAARLSVPTGTPNFSLSDRALSSCWTVAKVDLGERKPFSSSAFNRIPPIFPAPKTATRLPARSNPIFSSDRRDIAPAFPGTLCHQQHLNCNDCSFSPSCTAFMECALEEIILHEQTDYKR